MTPLAAPTTTEDYGFFGPGSPTWKVWTSPTALIGFQRSVVLEHFDPNLAAAVADMRGIYTDPGGRLDRTLAYFLTVAVADSRTAIAASEFLMKVHAKATGIEPISGKRYSANNPASPSSSANASSVPLAFQANAETGAVPFRRTKISAPSCSRTIKTVPSP